MSLTWIEASAGTGKTYTLVQKVLELVGRGLPVDKILLVTFTEKATAELKTRIRQGLREAWKKTSDPLLAQALEDIPSLSITTIHGFCRALLTQFPLESGISFEPEMVDQGRQWRRLLRDELRLRLTTLEANLLAWAGLEDEEALIALAKEALNRNVFSLPLAHPDAGELRTFTDCRIPLENGTGPLWQALSDVDLELPEDSGEGLGSAVIARFLHASFHKRPYRAVQKLLAARNFRDLYRLLDSETLELLGKWKEGTNIWKKNVTEAIPAKLEALRAVAGAFCQAAQHLVSALPPGISLSAFLSGTARYQVLNDLCLPVLERRSTRELTFHDLIDRVRNLVNSEAGSSLKAGASTRWKAVLIDEFQDTDQEQWEIFRALFADDQHDLVLVGDPKQSIYRFRGADLAVYRAVGRELQSRGAQQLILEENFRSTAPMIAAVNQLFSPKVAPWDHPDDFHPSLKGAKSVGELVRRENGVFTPVAPLAVFQSADEQTWHRHLVKTVLELLDGSYFLQTQDQCLPLLPGDFLILVRKKHQAWSLFRLLTSKGIPATVGGSGGLLHCREAQEILLFLKALESPRSVSAAQALGWTRLFSGTSADDLAPALEEAQHDRHRGALLRAFRRVLASLEPGTLDGGGLERLLALPGGSRIVTNAEHVLELVQERYHQGEVPPNQLALSLETWIQSGLQEDEVDLRRDGEDQTLRIMTIHAAKGLEAPVVLHGRPSEPKKDKLPWVIGSEGADFLLTEESQSQEARNQAAEELRLQYVAQTRAVTHQMFISPAAEGASPVPNLSFEDWYNLVPWTGPEEKLPRVPVLGSAIEGLANRHPWVESHSGLWKRASKEEEAPTAWDRPRVARDDEAQSGSELLLESLAETLPAGAAFGDLVHDILEEADFTSADSLAVVAEQHCQRRRAAFQNRDLTKPLTAWLSRVLSEPLFLGKETPPVVFSNLAGDQTRRELEFHLPFGIDTQHTIDWGDHSLTVHPGYLTGRIDLLFLWHGKLFLADWKTNRLSPEQELDEVMREAGYDLQAQWYWEALTRLCLLQNEPCEPGGVLYVFLRGAGDKPRGVFLSPEDLSISTLRTVFRQEVNHA